jgi:hypothetical protein
VGVANPSFFDDAEQDDLAHLDAPAFHWLYTPPSLYNLSPVVASDVLLDRERHLDLGVFSHANGSATTSSLVEALARPRTSSRQQCNPSTRCATPLPSKAPSYPKKSIFALPDGEFTTPLYQAPLQRVISGWIKLRSFPLAVTGRQSCPSGPLHLAPTKAGAAAYSLVQPPARVVQMPPALGHVEGDIIEAVAASEDCR